MSDQTLEDLGIDETRNSRPGDNLSSNRPSNLMFEPAAELVELPSHGLLYKNITSDPDIIEKGSIRVRPMTVNEEKILTTSRLVKSGQALDMIFSNCIKSDIEPGELLSSDRVFVMLWLRSISYGNIYKFNITCPNNACGRRFEYEVDLSEHPIHEMEEGTEEPFEINLPVMKYTVHFRLPRGKDEVEIIKMQNKPKKMNDTDDSIVQRLSSIMTKIEDPSGQEVPKTQYSRFVESLVGRDASAIRNLIDKKDAGVEDIKGIRCPYCDHEFDTPIPITENFFRSE